MIPSPTAFMAEATRDAELISDWRKLTTSDHFYYMCTKYFADGDVHKYFNPYESPYDSYINLMNVLDNLRTRAEMHERGGGSAAPGALDARGHGGAPGRPRRRAVRQRPRVERRRRDAAAVCGGRRAAARRGRPTVCGASPCSMHTRVSCGPLQQARAALEGIALQNVDILSAMESDLGAPVTERIRGHADESRGSRFSRLKLRQRHGCRFKEVWI